MVKVNSVSGGETSAYIMANFKADYNIFQLVRTDFEDCLWMKGKDEKTRQLISDRIGMEFIGTMEEDECIYTILDLEQYLGQEIKINTSYNTFEMMIKEHGERCLPSVMRRYCTDELKMQIAFEWWQKTCSEVVEMRIGYRANEMYRVKKMQKQFNEDGLFPFKHIIGSKETKKGKQNIWKTTYWQKPSFPLIEKQPTWKDDIKKFWKGKPIRFAEFNNCVGCFHREPLLLKYMWQKHPNKMQHFSDFEKDRKYNNDTFKCDDNVTYERIKNMNLTQKLTANDFSECDSGYCGM
tara:strand:- start:353 stop:1234 length:882 start_codon:yes stop_codon:yes gene_type:complete